MAASIHKKVDKVKVCSRCGADSEVTESRVKPDGTVRRRRQCVECGFKWTTIEVYSYEYEQLQDFKESKRLDKLIPPRFKGYETR